MTTTLTRYGILLEAPTGQPFNRANPPYSPGDIIDVPFEQGMEQARVEAVEWFPNGGASIYLLLVPVSGQRP